MHRTEVFIHRTYSVCSICACAPVHPALRLRRKVSIRRVAKAPEGTRNVRIGISRVQRSLVDVEQTLAHFQQLVVLSFCFSYTPTTQAGRRMNVNIDANAIGFDLDSPSCNSNGREHTTTCVPYVDCLESQQEYPSVDNNFTGTMCN
eukprot:1426923-Pyramimonas_sp.AAC.3